MIYILYGEDDFTIRETVARIRGECGGDELSGANFVRFDGTKVSPDELMAACQTLSFLAPKRMVVVEGLLGHLEGGPKRSRGRKRAADGWEGFAEQVKAMPESTVLVLVEGKLSRNNAMLKALAPPAEAREYRAPGVRSPELREWIRKRASAGGSEVSPAAMAALIDLIGNNLWVLAGEIEKLSVYTNGRRIEEPDVRELVAYARESNVFAMVDAIVQGRLGTAALLRHQLSTEGAAAPYLLYMITRQFRLLLQAKELMGARTGPREIGKRLGITSEFALEKTLEQARQYTYPRLEHAYKRLLETDLAVKTGSGSGEAALDLLIADLCR